MFDFALLAKGGADKADRSTAVALDFEVERKRFAFNGHKISIIDSTNQVKIDYCMASNEMKNGCGLSTEALLAGNLKRRCDKTSCDRILAHFLLVKSFTKSLRARLKRCARALFPVTLSRWNAADRTTVISPMPNGAAWRRLFPPPNTAGVPPNTLGVRS